MTALAGKALLCFACLWLGWDRSRGRRRRTDCLRDFRAALADLGRELAFSLAPVDDLLRRGGPGRAGDFFAACRDRFRAEGGESWAESWRQTLEEADLPLTPGDRAILVRAGEVLGRWDGDAQRRALEEVLLRLDEAIRESDGEARRLCRVDLALGGTAGAFCLLLL